MFSQNRRVRPAPRWPSSTAPRAGSNRSMKRFRGTTNLSLPLLWLWSPSLFWGLQGVERRWKTSKDVERRWTLTFDEGRWLKEWHSAIASQQPLSPTFSLMLSIIQSQFATNDGSLAHATLQLPKRLVLRLRSRDSIGYKQVSWIFETWTRRELTL